MPKHVFVLGPDERNLEMLRESPALDDCVLHRLLDSDDLVHVDRIDFDGCSRQPNGAFGSSTTPSTP